MGYICRHQPTCGRAPENDQVCSPYHENQSHMHANQRMVLNGTTKWETATEIAGKKLRNTEQTSPATLSRRTTRSRNTWQNLGLHLKQHILSKDRFLTSGEEDSEEVWPFIDALSDSKDTSIPYHVSQSVKSKENPAIKRSQKQEAKSKRMKHRSMKRHV
ncbi:hypothetical protein GQ600_16279 [Phytophthora cactorum]|nr:hypothetical protein GQ600_16279 [Phytophthora cactorum]